MVALKCLAVDLSCSPRWRAVPQLLPRVGEHCILPVEHPAHHFIFVVVYRVKELIAFLQCQIPEGYLKPVAFEFPYREELSLSQAIVAGQFSPHRTSQKLFLDDLPVGVEGKAEGEAT